jgi:TetR/AcrR family transcriptional regulator, mexJK operon transcriptional repressor
MAEVADPVAQQVASLRDSGDLEGDLRDLAHALLAQVIQARVMQLRRLVIAEAGRFPDLGRLFYEHGPGRTIGALATAFQHLAARGALQADDPQTAAEHFNWLVMSTPVNQVMLCGDTEPPDRASLSRYADAGTRAFLAAYGPG